MKTPISAWHLTVLSIISAILFPAALRAQVPGTEWEKRHGGTGTDGFNTVAQTSDGGYIAAGVYQQRSPTAQHDYWILRMDSGGNIVWQKTYGGTTQDRAYSVIQTQDGGYVVGGTTMSRNGDVSGHHGGDDAWVLKLDSLGNIIWKRCIGGSGSETLSRIIALPSGNVMILGTTSSDDGDLKGINTVGFWGESNIWLMETDPKGNILWQKTYGGRGYDAGYDMIRMSDGGFTLCGTEARPGSMYDMWVCRTDAAGNILWEKVFGYGDYDRAYALTATGENDILVAGYTLSKEFPGFSGGPSDAVIARLDGTTGDLVWHKAIGGNGSDWITGITYHNGLYILAGTSNSNDGAVSHPIGNWDVWLVAIDDKGNIHWDKNFGGRAEEGNPHKISIINTSDNGLVVASMSGSEELPGGGGLWDGYVFKLKNSATDIEESAALQNSSVYPNPVKDILHIRTVETGIHRYYLAAISGRVIRSGSFESGRGSVDVADLPAGAYILHLQNERQQSVIRKIIRE